MTQFAGLGGKAIELLRSFKRPIVENYNPESKVSAWLFQLPSTFVRSVENLQTLTAFFGEANLGGSALIEFRYKSWWEHKEKVCKEAGALFCSVDAPGLPREILALNGRIYLRLHGRNRWHSSFLHEDGTKGRTLKVTFSSGRRRSIYLNNDHGMLPNGKVLMDLLLG